jgi:hypothetical protein
MEKELTKTLLQRLKEAEKQEKKRQKEIKKGK